MNYDVNTLAFALGKPSATGQFKASAEDFKVKELLGFEFTGTGEHLCLHIEKQGLNTEELIKALSKALSKPIRAISYAGLKDKHAITTQWVSVHCPGEQIEGAETLGGNGWRVIEATRHAKKIRHGAVKSNRFLLVIKEISDIDNVEERLKHIKTMGVPNYFGPQRFGIQGQNIVKAEQMLMGERRVKDRFLKGMYFSAARSFLFNQILSARVAQNTWQQAIPGDVMQLSGSQSFFHIDLPDKAINQRIQDKDIVPASVLWGKSPSLTSAGAQKVQQQALMGLEHLCDALAQHDLKRAYRAHRLDVEEPTWTWHRNQLTLEFTLTAGGYATSVLRELIQ